MDTRTVLILKTNALCMLPYEEVISEMKMNITKYQKYVNILMLYFCKHAVRFYVCNFFFSKELLPQNEITFYALVYLAALCLLQRL